MIVPLFAIGGWAHAQEYPAKAVRIIVPFAPGGPNDLAVRPVAQKLYELLGQPFVVDYRAGANGIIGSELVAKSAPDGYTLLIISSSFTINASTYAKLPFDPLRDFAPVSSIATSDIIFVVNPTVPARSVKEFVALAKSRPGKLNYASSGTGGSLHLGAELLKMTAGINMVHVPYKGAALALTDVIGGQFFFFPRPVGGPPKEGELLGGSPGDAGKSPPAKPAFPESLSLRPTGYPPRLSPRPAPPPRLQNTGGKTRAGRPGAGAAPGGPPPPRPAPPGSTGPNTRPNLGRPLKRRGQGFPPL